MVSDSDGFIVVCFEIQILFALHTKPNDKRHKLIQRLGPVKPKHEKRKRKLLERNRQWMYAYGDGFGGGKDAQIMVKKSSSKCYTSHRMVPKAISVALDT